MHTTIRSIAAAAFLATMLIGARPALAQKDGLEAFPNVYKVQFENSWVRLIRIKLPGHAELADHTHPPGIMLHVYFNDADPVQFNHDGPPNDVTRPPVKARSYRVGYATPEVHSVINTGAGMSDYMRVELKTEGNSGQRSRVPAPALVNVASSVVEVTNAQYRTTRVTVASGQTSELTASEAGAALFLALTDGIVVDESEKPARQLTTGSELFLDRGARAQVRSGGSSPIQLLRIDFLTAPTN